MTDDALSAELESLTNWTRSEDGTAISRTFTFRNFREAFGWMTACALEAEAADHHPEWRNVYKTVEVSLLTHDTGGLTKKDVALAKAMDRHAAGYLS
ncbi:MAG: 4a-hydroxytetrahydrobiopterin dehydratase [Pseudomonadota bacterium]